MWILIHRIFREFNMFLDVIGANEPGPFEGFESSHTPDGMDDPPLEILDFLWNISDW